MVSLDLGLLLKKNRLVDVMFKVKVKHRNAKNMVEVKVEGEVLTPVLDLA